MHPCVHRSSARALTFLLPLLQRHAAWPRPRPIPFFIVVAAAWLLLLLLVCLPQPVLHKHVLLPLVILRTGICLGLQLVELGSGAGVLSRPSW